MKRTTTVVAILGAAMAGGCTWFGGGKGEDLDAGRRFAVAGGAGGAGGAGASVGGVDTGGPGGVGNPVAPARNTPDGVDQPGYVAPPESGSAPAQEDTGVTRGGLPAQEREVVVPEVVREEVSGTAQRQEQGSAAPIGGATGTSAAPPTAAATTTRRVVVGASNGTYMTLGGVVAEVNQRPIYANQVLREIVGPLSARARDLDEQQFRQVAARLIDEQIKRLANNERETAVAERNLEERDKQQARAAAARWRTRQITESGGSIENAKRRWAAEGYDFEERVDEEYRKILAQIYYAKKVWPRVQVRAEEVRQYYNQHLADEFTVKDEVKFRLIKVDVRRTGGREQALAKVTDLRTRAARGEDFAALAGSVNDDGYLMRNKGDVGWVQKGNYAIAAVEKAVWDLQPGEVSDIIDAGNAFYVAKLEERKLGRVRPFDELAVQDQIVKNLKAAQFRELRDKVINTLSKNSVVRSDADMVGAAIEMAVQNYDRWHRGES